VLDCTAALDGSKGRACRCNSVSWGRSSPLRSSSLKAPTLALVPTGESAAASLWQDQFELITHTAEFLDLVDQLYPSLA